MHPLKENPGRHAGGRRHAERQCGQGAPLRPDAGGGSGTDRPNRGRHSRWPSAANVAAAGHAAPVLHSGRCCLLQGHVWDAIRPAGAGQPPAARQVARLMFGSDVSLPHGVDSAERNAQRCAGAMGAAVGTAARAATTRYSTLARRLPDHAPGVMSLNPPYGERIEAAGGPVCADKRAASAPAKTPQTEDGGGVFQPARHPLEELPAGLAWALTRRPSSCRPRRCGWKESRREPMEQPGECRLFRFTWSYQPANRMTPLPPPESALVLTPNIIARCAGVRRCRSAAPARRAGPWRSLRWLYHRRHATSCSARAGVSQISTPRLDASCTERGRRLAPV